MSTWLYLECHDHTPPLIADGESGQHLYDLPRIQADIRDRAQLVAHAKATRDLEEVVGESYFRRHTLAFLVQHPTCRIGIRDEYGTQHPTEDAS